ncbi:MFS transporter [Pontivivens ytuae]|uniref:MFS transporter n=1 Tax=Pontivivens ytuae TaxID=2789856 RepID=A0A7S9LVE6_9RHOB|nr:MFS transporter [Pontivivens ytuae]QPH55690.1 MFS transporter [Pontivivens ytuae]
MKTLSLQQAQSLPIWRQPIALLVVMAAAMPLAFSTWNALLNNFVIEAAAFDGSDIGWLQSVREIPGFLAVGVIAIIIFMREQVLGLVSLIMLGVAVAVTAYFPTFQGLLATTLISSIGFHYYETVNQSLQLQWIDKAKAPQVLGWIVAVGSGASLLAYGILVMGWERFGWSYEVVYLAGGGATVLLAIICFLLYPQFESPNPQTKKMVLRRRYWLYYALQFMSGARRQIFVVFAAFMMVERFGFEVHEVTALFLANYLANMVFAPLMGRFVQTYGERRALTVEYTGLICIFVAYGALYFADWGALAWGVAIAAGLYILDHLFFALAFALKTYFQKIADPADIAPTAAVAFTINHIAAVFLPAALGYLWLTSPAGVFLLAAGFASISLVLALLIPRHPAPGRETIFALRFTAAPAE